MRYKLISCEDDSQKEISIPNELVVKESLVKKKRQKDPSHAETNLKMSQPNRISKKVKQPFNKAKNAPKKGGKKKQTAKKLTHQFL